ncbi:MAG: beta-ketoacyl-[acyl-carrier-protein] synthase family protein [Verrucomicrobiales bacterium]|nr:beta-ketoacyl-[acyl-carrier-protein] synthase family protein [Verrucomicrobiales bacterium]
MGDPVETPAQSIEVTVAGCGAITALGRGVPSLDRVLRGADSGLRPAEFRTGPGPATVRLVAGPVSADALGHEPGDAREDLGDRAFRMALIAAGEASVNAGEALSRISCERQGLVVSTTKAGIEALERLVWREAVDAAEVARIQPGGLTRDLARALRVGGPVQCVSAACISGLLALRQGMAMIQRGDADAVHVVGIDVISAFVVTGFASLKSMDPEGCRPFDRARVGLSLGEGAGAMVLARARGGEGEPSESGVRVTGWGSSNDANHLTGPSRDGSGLALAIGRALAKAGKRPAEVDCVHAHGTGTPYNDAMEALAIRTVFGDSPPPVGSSKGALGHTLGAAGVLESIICVRALEEAVLPGTPRLREADSQAPTSMVFEPRPEPGLRTVVKVNSGFGGTNAAMVFERGRA